MSSNRSTACMAVGLLLLLAAFCLTGYNIWDGDRAGTAAEKAFLSLKDVTFDSQERGMPEKMIPYYELYPQMEMPVISIDGYEYVGYLEIPALELTLPIMESCSDEQMKVAPCRYSGSAYLDTMVIAGHNYRRHFGGLKNLSAGDAVWFTDADGNRFVYAIDDFEQLRPNQTLEMIDNDYDFTLFTCTTGGRLRMAVRCSRTEDTMATADTAQWKERSSL